MNARAELHADSLTRLHQRAKHEEARVRSFAEAVIAPDVVDLEHERDQAYRRGRADALAMLARRIETERVELGRAERAIGAVQP